MCFIDYKNNKGTVMAITELYSQRQKRLNGDLPDTYSYDFMPNTLKNQIFFILDDAIGNAYVDNGQKVYDHLYSVLCREMGIEKKDLNRNHSYKLLQSDFMNYNTSLEYCLDFIELAFKIVDGYIRKQKYSFNVGHDVTISPDSAIKELNYRFKQAAVGYRFESGMIMKCDSDFMHSEAVKPVLQLLKKNDFYKGANQEFLHAHELYLNKKYEASMTDCLKSLESLIKGVCDQRGWSYTAKDNASKLIAKCFDNSLIPPYMNSEFTALKSLLESGTPTVRNKSAGHGQGAQVRDVPEHLVRLALNLTATHLLFLMECNEELG